MDKNQIFGSARKQLLAVMQIVDSFLHVDLGYQGLWSGVRPDPEPFAELQVRVAKLRIGFGNLGFRSWGLGV